MPLELVTVPCLADNYAFLLHSAETGETALVDAPEAAPILQVLKTRGWSLSEIWLTHHHWDHVDGLAELRDVAAASVTGAAADAGRLPPLSRSVTGGGQFSFAGHSVCVMDVPGHTLGHIAYHVPAAKAVFTGDSLMALGCGRLFEGTPEQMWASLARLAALPEDTRVCSGHEYTLANAAFALSIDAANPDLQARAKQTEAMRANRHPTVPSLLSLELATNPFLRASDPAIRSALGMEHAPDSEVFAEIRRQKDAF